MGLVSAISGVCWPGRKRSMQCKASEQSHRVQSGQWRVGVGDDKQKFGAAEDDSVAVGIAGTEHLEAASGQPPGIDVATDEPSSPDKPKANEAASCGVISDNIRDVQPRSRRARLYICKRQVDGVVRADQEVSADAREVCGPMKASIRLRHLRHHAEDSARIRHEAARASIFRDAHAVPGAAAPLRKLSGSTGQLHRKSRRHFQCGARD